jgi:hypothetical protein
MQTSSVALCNAYGPESMTDNHTNIYSCVWASHTALYHVTLRSVRVTTVIIGKHYYYIFSVCVCVCVYMCARACVCSLRYPACKAHAPYYIVICGLSGSIIFFPIISYTAIFAGRGEVLNIKGVFGFIYNFYLKHFSL